MILLLYQYTIRISLKMCFGIDQSQNQTVFIFWAALLLCIRVLYECGKEQCIKLIGLLISLSLQLYYTYWSYMYMYFYTVLFHWCYYVNDIVLYVRKFSPISPMRVVGEDFFSESFSTLCIYRSMHYFLEGTAHSWQILSQCKL